MERGEDQLHQGSSNRLGGAARPDPTEDLVEDLDRGERRDVAVIERWRDLDEIQRANRQLTEHGAEELEEVAGGQSAGLRGSRPWGEGRIEDVDVDRDVDSGCILQPGADGRCRRLDPVGEHIARGVDPHLGVVGEVRAFVAEPGPGSDEGEERRIDVRQIEDPTRGARVRPGESLERVHQIEVGVEVKNPQRGFNGSGGSRDERDRHRVIPTEEEGEVTPSADMIAVPKESVVPSDKEEAVPEELESGEAIAAAPLSDVERYQLQLERKPKDNSIRLALARAYRDQEKVKLALEQYGALVRAKSSLLAQAVADVEGIIASRPDNLEAHELLADLYAKSGQLPKAVDRLRWIQQRLEQKYP